ncbi:tRNA intron endonuclease [Macleaya cordata]|uniref:tRNA-intron lyase n=1 Tax=Macleaya cordata TaxID=56857 RepID=A0A200PZ22_MACCD|nr:tRNA intron endonuclease [Macleaya cordata]
MGPRWKGKNSEAIALADPMSKITARLQSSLIQSETEGFLSGCVVLLSVEPEQIDLLNRACFGRPIITTDKDKQWFQISLEEAFYLCHSLKCLKILDENKCAKNGNELWECMKSKKKTFPEFYVAYSNLKKKNWVVRSGSQYGVDFVAYRHHPSLVHSEYAVLVRSECDGDYDKNFRLRVWSDFQCTVRLCGSVAKTLLVLNINTNGCNEVSLSHLDHCSVEERTITRWSPEQCREDLTLVKGGISYI